MSYSKINSAISLLNIYNFIYTDNSVTGCFGILRGDIFFNNCV